MQLGLNILVCPLLIFKAYFVLKGGLNRLFIVLLKLNGFTKVTKNNFFREDRKCSQKTTFLVFWYNKPWIRSGQTLSAEYGPF